MCVGNIKYCTTNERGKEKVPFKDKSGSCCQGDSRCSSDALTREKTEACSERIALGSIDFNVLKSNLR